MAASRPTGYCHCGKVSVSVPALPVEITRCNCSLCTKTGAVWAYYDPGEVAVTTDAPLASYVRGDMAEPCLATDRCNDCGSIVRWRAIVALDVPRMGVNMNLFDPAAIAGIEVRAVDGRSWPL